MGSMNSNFKVEMKADIIFESEISDISTKLKKKINITSSHQSETHYVYA